VSDTRDDSLLRAMDAIRERLKFLEGDMNPVACVAEGKLEVALAAVESAAELLDEGP
jgi:hypothetical protein